MILSDIFSRRLRDASPALVLVVLCAAVFVLLRLTAVVLNLSDTTLSIGRILDSLMLSAAPSALAARPWTPLTYMFVHYDVLHLMMNLLWLYMFASIARNLCSRPQSVYIIFLAGGLAGAAAFLLAGTTVPAVNGRSLTGASAAILAIMAFAMMRAPGLRLRLVFFGETSLKIVGLIAILLVVISSGTDAGSYGLHAAHAAGFLTGLGAACFLRSNRPQSSPFTRTSTRQKPSPTAVPDDRMLDSLLDKIRRSGYNSLSPDERETLFSISSKLRNRQ